MAKIFLTTPGDGTFTAPSDWPGQADSVECLGGGGGGSGNLHNVSYSQGGAGGAYSKKNGPLTFGTGTAYHVGEGGAGTAQSNAAAFDGGDTWFGHASYGSAICGARGGKGGTRNNDVGVTTGLGGSSSAGIGDVKYSGNSPAGPAVAGAGGAAGPSGNGAGGGFGGQATNYGGPGGGGADGGAGGGSTFTGTNGVGGAGANGGGRGGDGMVGGGFKAQDGSAGTEWDSTHGSGGGGGGGGSALFGANSGGHGGAYGGGGGAGSLPENLGGEVAVGGNGYQGIIVITYTPGGGGGPVTKTVTITLTTQSGVPRANLSGLKWAFWDVATPDQITGAPVNKGTGETTDANGVLVLSVPDSSLTNAQIGWLNVTDSNGTLTQTPRHKAFAGPVAVSVS
jgi:hypothetical protein